MVGDWRRVLRCIVSRVANTRVADWRYPSRRHPSYPRYRRLGEPSVILLIEVSGAVPPEVIRDFVEEVHRICSWAGVRMLRLIYWSGTVVKEALIRGRAGVEGEKDAAANLLSRGARLGPALEKAVRYAWKNNVLVVLSSGRIEDEEGVRNLAVRAASRYGRAVFVTTSEKPVDKVPEPPWVYAHYSP